MKRSDIVEITAYDEYYPPPIGWEMGASAPNMLYAIGRLDLLQTDITGYICSRRCPPSLIVKTQDAFVNIRNTACTIASGFHSPVEQEVLQTLLPGTALVIALPARSIQSMRLSREYQVLLEQERLLIISPFEAEKNRITSPQSAYRNHLLAALSSRVLVSYAHPGGQAEALCRNMIETYPGKLYTFPGEHNQSIIDRGAKEWR